MNAKKAKALRRKARELSPGMPERQLLGRKTQRTVIRGGKTYRLDSSQAANNPNTTRGIYRLLKRSA